MFIAIASIMDFVSKLFKKPVDPNMSQSLADLVTSSGYGFEEHLITTNDGYKLRVQRIFNPNLKNHENNKPVLLQHGLAGSSSHWLINSKEEHLSNSDSHSSGAKNKPKISNNIGFALAREGYDVWLANCRGNHYGKGHKVLTINDPAFWDFSMDEIIANDLPNTIDYVLAKTGKSTIGYVGFSQGSTVMFGLLSSKPEYNEKIKPFIAMAPLTSLYNTNSPSRWVPTVVKLLAPKDLHYVLDTDMMRWLFFGHWFESLLHLGYWLFSQFTFGLNLDQADFSRLANLVMRPVGDLSLKIFYHHNQMYLKGPMAKYDYGKQNNKTVYGQEFPPLYNLSSITCEHIAFIYGKNDKVVHPKDLNILRKSLQVALIDDYQVEHEHWSHFDFHFAKELGKYVTPRLLKILKKCHRF